MPVDIGPRIGIDGEKEFRQELQTINQHLRTLGSEMKAVTSAFEDDADSQEALEAQVKVLNQQITVQKQKLDQLQKGLDAAADRYGENNTKTLKWSQAVQDATTNLNKLQSQLGRVQGEMSGSGNVYDNLTRKISNQERELAQLRQEHTNAVLTYGKTSDAAQDLARRIGTLSAELKDNKTAMEQAESATNGIKTALDDAGSSGGGLSSLLSGGGLGGMLTKGLAVGAVVGGVQQLAGAMFDVVESTQEYRTIMASLESSSTAAGYTAEQTTATYQRLQSVLGDTQTAATATANLQAIGLSQEDLMTVTDAAIGAWARYGDSIPIDGLAESINETIQAGQVTGTFADVLNWAGTSEDDFNAKLEEASTASERANIVMEELARQGLAESGAAWIENNQDITEANEATEKMDAAMARLGETLAPAASALKSFGADAINFLIDKGLEAVDFFTELPDKAREVGSDIIEGMWNGIDAMGDWIGQKIQGFGDGILQSIKDFFGIHSPSTVMRDQVGVMIARGLALGMEKGQTTVERTAVRLGQAIEDEISKVNDEIAKLEQAELDQQAEEELAERDKKLQELYDKLGEAEADERQGILDEISELQAEWDAEQVKKAREAEKEAAEARLKELEAFQAEYEKALEDIQDSQADMADRLRNYGDLFETADGKIELGDLQDQIDQIREYSDALEVLRERGVSDSLLDEITGLDIGEATSYVDELLAMTDEQYGEYMALWEIKQREAQRVAEEFYSSELDALNAEYVQKIPEALGELKDELSSVGQDSALGLADGFVSQSKTIQDAFVSTIQQALDAAKAEMGIHSPSTVWRDEVGANMALGLGEGFIEQMQSMAGTITRSIPTPTVDTVNNAAAGMVNGLSAASAGQNFPSTIVLQLQNGAEIARWLLPDLRRVERANPEVVSGV